MYPGQPALIRLTLVLLPFRLPFRALLVVGNNVVLVVVPTVHNFFHGFDRMFSESFIHAIIRHIAGFDIADMEATDKHCYRYTSIKKSHGDVATVCGQTYPNEGGQCFPRPRLRYCKSLLFRRLAMWIDFTKYVPLARMCASMTLDC